MSPKCYSDNGQRDASNVPLADAGKGRGQAWLRLAAWTTGISAVWLIVLPWAAARPAMQQRIGFFEQQRIDPSAMFYTEIEMMEEVQDRIDRLRHQHAEHFWNPVPRGS
jgi:4-amino-4-deoxy-L-arabinose transferase-like glycosyltransferase